MTKQWKNFYKNRRRNLHNHTPKQIEDRKDISENEKIYPDDFLWYDDGDDAEYARLYDEFYDMFPREFISHFEEYCTFEHCWMEALRFSPENIKKAQKDIPDAILEMQKMLDFIEKHPEYDYFPFWCLTFTHKKSIKKIIQNIFKKLPKEYF